MLTKISILDRHSKKEPESSGCKLTNVTSVGSGFVAIKP